jgi:phosphoribosylglycinamide formyltransferase-1
LLSGRGTNLCALADRARHGKLPIDIRAVISDRADAAGLDRARERDIPALSLSLRDFPSREAFDSHLGDLVAGFAPGLVVLAGYMKILSPTFVRRFTGKLINIHPSLLPKYPGLHTHRRALAAGEREHGASVHFVVEALDSGPTIVQGRVPVKSTDTEDSLAARVQQAEHIIYPQAVDWIACGRVIMRDNRVVFDGKELTTPAQIDIFQ